MGSWRRTTGRSRAGFLPRLPAADVFPSVSPTYAVADITAARVRLRTPAIRYRGRVRPGQDVAAVWSGADRVYALYPETREVSREFIATVAAALE